MRFIHRSGNMHPPRRIQDSRDSLRLHRWPLFHRCSSCAAVAGGGSQSHCTVGEWPTFRIPFFLDSPIRVPSMSSRVSSIESLPLPVPRSPRSLSPTWSSCSSGPEFSLSLCLNPVPVTCDWSRNSNLFEGGDEPDRTAHTHDDQHRYGQQTRPGRRRDGSPPSADGRTERRVGERRMQPAGATWPDLNLFEFEFCTTDLDHPSPPHTRVDRTHTHHVSHVSSIHATRR